MGLFAHDVRALDRDLYVDSLRGAALAYVHLQQGLYMREVLQRLSAQVACLTGEVSAAVAKRDQAVAEASKDGEKHRSQLEQMSSEKAVLNQSSQVQDLRSKLDWSEVRAAESAKALA